MSSLEGLDYSTVEALRPKILIAFVNQVLKFKLISKLHSSFQIIIGKVKVIMIMQIREQ
jgi:hypothetical protein